MTEDELKAIAQQLRKPEGEYALQVGEKMNEGNLHINESAIQALNAQSGEKILEIGMGNGHFVEQIIGHNSSISYAGCDYSKEMVTEATKRNRSFVENGQAKFHLTDGNILPVPDQYIDKVLTINTIYFWDEPAVIFNEIKRVLKPTGQLFIAIRPKDQMQQYPFTKYGFTTFGSNELEKFVSDHGFAVMDIVHKDMGEQPFLDNVMRDEFFILTAKLKSS